MDPKTSSENPLNKYNEQNPNLVELMDAVNTGEYESGADKFEEKLSYLSATDLWDLRRLYSDPHNSGTVNMNPHQRQWANMIDAHMRKRGLFDEKNAA